MKRPLFIALILYIFGEFFGRYFGLDSSIGIILFAAFLILAGAALLFQTKKIGFVFMPLIALLGFFLVSISLSPASTALENAAEAGEIAGIVADVEYTYKTGGGNTGAIVKVESAEVNGVTIAGTRGIKLYILDSGNFIRPGDVISFEAQVVRLDRQRNPGGYDEFMHLRTMKVEYKLFPKEITATGQIFSLGRVIASLRESAAKNIDRAFEPSQAGIIKALVIGDKSEILPEDKELYKDIGIYHILAVSGLHVGIIAVAVQGLLSFLLYRRQSIIATLAIMWFYCVFTGAGVATVRAVIMYSAVSVSTLLYRDRDTLSGAALAALILLIYEPLYLWNSGFQYSFAAVFGMTLLSPAITRLFDILKDKITIEGVLLEVSQNANEDPCAFAKDKSRRSRLRKAKRWASGRIFRPQGMRTKTALESSIESFDDSKPHRPYSSGSVQSARRSPLRNGVLCHLKRKAASHHGTRQFKHNKIKAYLAQVIAASLVTYPITMYYFGTLSPVSILSNLVIVPSVFLLVISGFVVCLSGSFVVITAPFAVLASFLLSLYDMFGKIALSLPFAELATGRPYILQIAGYYAIIGWFIHTMSQAAGKIKANASVCFAAVLVFLCTSVVYARIPSSMPLTITMLDVGQGDCTVIEYNGAAMIIDGGGRYESYGGSTGAHVLIPYLRYRGIDSVDSALVSHIDADHVIGIIELLDGVSVKNLYLSYNTVEEGDLYELLMRSAAKNGATVIHMKSDDRITIGDLSISCLYPFENTSSNDTNNMSMALKLSYGSTAFLFTGDSPAKVENELIGIFGNDLDCDVYKLSHHGSKYSNTEGFLRAVSPAFVFAGASRNNPYGHPADVVKERLDGMGIDLFCTAENGAIIMRTDGKYIEVQTMLHER